MRNRVPVAGAGLMVLALGGGAAHGQEKAKPASSKSPAAVLPAATASPRPPFDVEKYFNGMEEDVAVYDPASPFIYDGKAAWRKRVDQMRKVREFLDLNQFHRTEVELGDMKIVTVYREIRRPEGSFTERLHGRITWVYLKQPDGQWFVWHDHTSEIPEDFQYQR
jgi:ketosteroid isomerase-like protein